MTLGRHVSRLFETWACQGITGIVRMHCYSVTRLSRWRAVIVVHDTEVVEGNTDGVANVWVEQRKSVVEE